MTITQLILLAIKGSIAILMFCIALSATPKDLIYLLHRPGLLMRSLFAMNVVMPLFALALALTFELNEAVEIALLALAVAPVPPILPKKQVKAGGDYSYIIGLLTVAALASIVLVPATVALLGRILARPTYVSPVTIASIVAMSILAPLGAGVVFRVLAPTAADRIARPLSIFATVLLFSAFLPVLIAQWRFIVALVGDFTLLAIVVYVLFGLAVGHLLGGPDLDKRTVLALSTASRHPAVAISILHQAADQKLVLAAVLLVLIVGGIASVPYVKLRARSHVERGHQGLAGRY